MKKCKTDKKGDMTVAVSALIFLIIGLSIVTLILIFTGVLGGKVYQITENDIDAIRGETTVTGDTFTATNNTYVTLDHKDINTAGFVVYNNTAPYAVIGLNNFTIDYDNGRIKFYAVTDYSSGLNLAVLGANYTYGSDTIRNNIKSGIVSSFDASKQTAELTPVVAMAFMIVIILGMIVGLTAIGGVNKGGKMGGSAL